MKSMKRESGFTLVELVIAMIIMSVGLLGLASSMGTIMRWQRLSAARAEMTMLADGKLEQLRGAGAVKSADITELAIGGSVSSAVEPHTDNVTGSQGGSYVLLWSVTAGPGGTRNVQMRVKPTVDRPTTPKQLDFSTLIALKP